MEFHLFIFRLAYQKLRRSETINTLVRSLRIYFLEHINAVAIIIPSSNQKVTLQIYRTSLNWILIKFQNSYPNLRVGFRTPPGLLDLPLSLPWKASNFTYSSLIGPPGETALISFSLHRPFKQSKDSSNTASNGV